MAFFFFGCFSTLRLLDPAERNGDPNDEEQNAVRLAVQDTMCLPTGLLLLLLLTFVFLLRCHIV